MKRLYNRAKEAIRPKAVVLMYHRVAELESDVWDIAVSPTHFEQQLQVLQKSGRVVPLKAIAAGVREGNLKRGSIALTFDDGYADNYTVAKQLLEHYKLPATFFITTGNLGQAKEFWWDSLEHLFLFTKELPENLNIMLGREMQQFEFGEETHLTDPIYQAHRQWKASEQAPPTVRARHYLQIWQKLQPLPHEVQQEALQKLFAWAGQSTIREGYQSMSVLQLQELGGNPLFDIGIHTLTHPALAYHQPDYQQQEIIACRQHLQNVLNNSIDLLAYPFGNHNEASITIAADEKLLAAVTTKEQLVSTSSHPYRLGRFQVKNWQGPLFENHLQRWSKRK